MKKLLLLLACVVMYTGCEKSEPDKLELTESQITLNYGDEYQVKVTSGSPITYTVSNNYNASVSETGLVKARFVGETDITVSSGEESKVLKVTVAPKSKLYNEPKIVLGMTKSEAIQILGAPDVTTNTGIGYDNYSISAPILAILFDSNNKIKSYSLMVEMSSSFELGIFLSERYFCKYTGNWLLFVNGIDMYDDRITMGAYTMWYNREYLQVIYEPFHPSTKSDISSLANSNKDTDELSEIMKVINIKK